MLFQAPFATNAVVATCTVVETAAVSSCAFSRTLRSWGLGVLGSFVALPLVALVAKRAICRLRKEPPRNLIKKPLALFGVLNKDPLILGIQNHGFPNQVPVSRYAFGLSDADRLRIGCPIVGDTEHGRRGDGGRPDSLEVPYCGGLYIIADTMVLKHVELKV